MTETMERRVAAIEARLEIQQLAARYARSVDSRDLEALGELFSRETRFGDFGTGPDGARNFYCSQPVLRTFYRSFHQVVGHVITDVDDLSARGTVYCRAEHEDGDNWVTILMIYFDRYVKQDGHWHFLGRRPRYLYVGDIRETPFEAGFCRWPGREGSFTAQLPQCDESWRRFWSDYPDDQARSTTRP